MQGNLKVETAVETAKTSLVQAFAGENPRSTRLEEIRLEGTTWKITISFDRRDTPLASVLGARSFKVVQIDDRTGRVLAITHRNINADTPS